MRIIWIMAGLLSLAFGTIGIFVPLLPTVPLVLLAAFCFAKSSPRLHDWLVMHPRFGRMIMDWRERGAIRRRAKILATLSIALVFGISLILRIAPLILTIQALVLLAVLTFIWTRPE